MPYCIYLRKSRADIEAEARGEGETLVVHKKRLIDLATARNLQVTEIYSEIMSGDTIAGRPEMQRLLRDVELGKWKGVLCNDIDRLGRGDGADQSRILKTFKLTNTLIITPYKDYNLSSSESDEEHMEFQQQFARFEYRHIKRRMQAGRNAAAQAGYYMSPRAPFGYRRKRIDDTKHFTLVIEPSEAEAVRMLFTDYANGVGKYKLANRLNSMGFRTPMGNQFFPEVVKKMLINPVYIGKIRWNFRQKKTSIVNGTEITSRKYSNECILVDGLHEAIITKEQWNTVQRIMDSHPDAHVTKEKIIKNPLCGLLFCSECGHSMAYASIRKSSDTHGYRCITPNCKTCSIGESYLYDTLRYILSEWSLMSDDEVDTEKKENSSAMADSIRQNIIQMNAQKDRLRDFLETGVYDSMTYLDRMGKLESRIRDAEAELSAIAKPCDATLSIVAHHDLIQQTLDVWDTATPAELNNLLRQFISKIIYHKLQSCKRNENPSKYLQLDVYPIIYE